MFGGAGSRLQRFFAARRRPRRRQAGALCWRRVAAGVEVLIITTRRTGRWTPPKGNLMSGKSPAEAAAIEAWEEAGVIGAVESRPIGTYEYMKLRSDGLWERLAVDVFPLEVEALEADFPEAGERKLAWTAQAEAARQVRENGLSRLIEGFAPPDPGASRRRRAEAT